MKHKIEQALICFENLQVRIKGKWYYMSLEKLTGVTVNGKLVTKRTRDWVD